MNKQPLSQPIVSGFTLIEVMVSVSIFAIIITMGIGALLTVNSTLQKTRADRQTIDSMSYVMDTITRRLRTGSGYEQIDGGISFTDQDGKEISFYQGNDERLYFDDTTDIYDITPPNLIIDRFAVELSGIDDAEKGFLQPMAIISISATTNNGKQQSQLSVQTAVSQRLLNFQ